MLSSAYRFRQPSLIALSNRLHYQGKLRIFPSPYVDEEHHGLVYRSVPNTIYDRGRSSTNIEEARAVARAVIDHAKRTPDQSLGVVALSTQQAEAITLELEVLRTQDPSTEAFFASNASEAFFVKNLENVQGDERDVIMVSIGYARDQEGRLPMNFGPLNQAGGERRLNVLMTRAKHRCEIFTAIDPAELRIEGKAKGVENLRAFLSYAKERMVQIDADRAAPPRNETAFQAHLREALESRGLKVKTNIGHANCTIDLAIVHPSDPSRYLLGVVTDLDPNAQHESARDRERIVPVMLRNLGWNVFRLWAMEYVSDPQGVIERIVKTVAQTAAAEPATVANKANNSAPETLVHRRAEVSNLAEAGGQAYVEAKLTVSRPAGVPLYTLPIETFAKWITKVVEVESPVHREEVDRRIRNAGDVDQSQSLADALAGGLRLALDRGLILQRGDFLYSKLDQPVRVRDRGALRSTASRKIDVVAPEEVEAAILFVVKHAFGIKPEELPDAVRWCLGVTTISDARKGMIIMQAETLREAGLIKQKGAFLH